MGVRLTQQPLEVLAAPATGRPRVTQQPLEVVAAPATGRPRLTQLAIEVVLGPTAGFPFGSGPILTSVIGGPIVTAPIRRPKERTKGVAL